MVVGEVDGGGFDEGGGGGSVTTGCLGPLEC